MLCFYNFFYLKNINANKGKEKAKIIHSTAQLATTIKIVRYVLTELF